MYKKITKAALLASILIIGFNAQIQADEAGTFAVEALSTGDNNSDSDNSSDNSDSSNHSKTALILGAVAAAGAGVGVLALNGNNNPIPNPNPTPSPFVGPNNTAIPGVQAAFDYVHNQVYLFHGHYYRVLQDNDISGKKSTFQLLGLDPKDILKLDNILDIYGDGNDLTHKQLNVFFETNAGDKKIYTYDWNTLQSDSPSFTDNSNKDYGVGVENSKTFGNSDYLKENYLFNSDTLALDDLMTDNNKAKLLGNLFFNGGAGITYASAERIVWDQVSGTWSDYITDKNTGLNNWIYTQDVYKKIFQKLKCDPNVPCAKTVINNISTNGDIGLTSSDVFEGNQYVSVSFAQDPGVSYTVRTPSSVSDFLKPYNLPNLPADPTLTDLFIDYRTSQDLSSTTTDLSAQAPQGLSITPTISTENPCFTIYNNSNTNYTALDVELNPPTASVQTLPPYEVFVDANAPLPGKGASYCFKTGKAPKLDQYTVDLIPPQA